MEMGLRTVIRCFFTAILLLLFDHQFSFYHHFKVAFQSPFHAEISKTWESYSWVEILIPLMAISMTVISAAKKVGSKKIDNRNMMKSKGRGGWCLTKHNLLLCLLDQSIQMHTHCALVIKLKICQNVCNSLFESTSHIAGAQQWKLSCLAIWKKLAWNFRRIFLPGLNAHEGYYLGDLVTGIEKVIIPLNCS